MHITLGQLLFAIVGAVVSILFYLTVRKLRAFTAWSQREPGPKERLSVFVPLSAAIGLLAGGMLHEPVNAALACKEMGKPVIECFLPHPK